MLIQLRRGTTSDWGTVNPVLATGEIGINTTTRQFKMGDGITAWTDLPYATQFTSEKNQPNGYAGLDGAGKIPNSLINFPAAADQNNVQNFANTTAFPANGNQDLLYLAADTMNLYHWDTGAAAYRVITPLPVATSSAFGAIKLTGDLGGTAETPGVVRINGVAVTGYPATGQVIKATSPSTATWQNDAVGAGGGGGGGADPRIGIFEQDIGDGTANPITITHMLGTRMVHVSLIENGGNNEIIDIVRKRAPTVNAVVIEPGVAIPVNKYRALIIASLGASDVTPPSAPTLTYVSEGWSSLSVSASGAADDVGVTAYHWFAKKTADAGPPQYVASTVGNTYTFIGLSAATSYTLAATAVDGAGNESPMSNTVVHSTTIPPTVVFDAVGAGNSLNKSAGSISTSWPHVVAPGSARILLAAFDVSHANNITPISKYATYSVTSDAGSADAPGVAKALTMVPSSAVQYISSVGYSSSAIAWFYLLNPTVGTHNLTGKWVIGDTSEYADGVRGNSLSYQNVDQVNPFVGTPVTGYVRAAGLNLSVPSTAGDILVGGVASNDDLGGGTPAVRPPVTGASVKGNGDYLTLSDALSTGAATAFQSTNTNTNLVYSIIELRKVT